MIHADDLPRWSTGAATVLLLIIVPPRALAQTAGLPVVREDVIVTATLAPVAAADLSRSVTMLTREDLERLGVFSVSDAVRLVPGADPRARGSHGVQTDFSLRGATFGQSLVLVDGLRLNDSQSAHHNGDIPMALSGIDRIEILAGGGSAVHGADALGGTLNFISRRDPHTDIVASAGQHGYVAGEGSLSGHGLPATFTATGWGARSGGFMFDRDFALGGGALRGSPSEGWTIDVRHQRKAFGANGFYGPSASREWTDQTLTSLAWRRVRGAWLVSATGLFRNHGDHFRWDIARPGFAENRHRTNAGELSVTMAREISTAARVTLGATGGGDVVTSSNLGHHAYGRGAVFGELQWRVAARTSATLGARFDQYSTFGRSVSPAVSLATHVGRDVRMRVSIAHAFRVPTFTELYYHDPANLGSPDLAAEHGWSIDGGLDWTRGGWTASASPFRRHDRDLIDWVRASATDLWRSTNVRDVTATGVETSLSRRWSDGFVRIHYARLTVVAPALQLLSKYVLEYAPHHAGVSLSLPAPGRARVALTADHRRRADRQSYTLVGVRISRRMARGELFVDATNLLNERYHEVIGVEPPGRWVTAGIVIR